MRWPKRLSLMVLVFPAIVAAAFRLGYYAWRQSTAQSQQFEQAIRRSNEAIAEQVVSVIEKEIIASDHTLFDLIDLANLKRFTDRWNELVRLSPNVDAVVVLDDQQKILALVARGGKESGFRQLFERRIRHDLHLDWLKVNQHMHLHSEYDGTQVLISYTHRRSGDRDYYIALSVDMQTVISQLLLPELEDLRETSRFSVVDSSGRIVYGDLLDRRSGFLYEKQFPSTLWRWRLQIAPKNIWQLISESRRRRAADAGLISLALVVILAGMAVLWLAMRKERKASELKSEFIANVSHELKTPLSLIRMFSELMALGKVRSPEMGREYAEIITRESERLARMIDNVLDFARIERGKAAYDFASGNLGDVVERALDVYRYRLEREKMKLEVDIEKNLPPVRLDENAMTLALLNLLENAVKYAAPSPVAIRLRRGGESIELSVEDHGPGVPEADVRKVFDRFYRAENVRHKNVRGSGIGLSLVKHVAEAHGGRVGLAATPGGGATFTISIPLAPDLEPGAWSLEPAERAAK